jgi:hypothetical protein
MAAVGLVWMSVSCWLLLLAAGAGNTDVRVVETPVRRKNPGSKKQRSSFCLSISRKMWKLSLITKKQFIIPIFTQFERVPSS